MAKKRVLLYVHLDTSVINPPRVSEQFSMTTVIDL